jgi:hypothetical protein
VLLCCAMIPPVSSIMPEGILDGLSDDESLWPVGRGHTHHHCLTEIDLYVIRYAGVDIVITICFLKD